MTTGYVVNLDNGHNGYCVEVLAGVTKCGETFERGEVDLEVFETERGPDHPHSKLCFDCSKADARKVRAAADERGRSA